VPYFTYLNNLIAGAARPTREIKSRIAMAQAAYNKKDVVTSKMD
jgi:hypothetical protein